MIFLLVSTVCLGIGMFGVGMFISSPR